MGKRKYDRDFKLHAVKLYEESGMKLKDFEEELGIGSGNVSHWRKEFNDEEKANKTPHEKEVSELKNEIENLKLDKAILKKALGIFSNSQGTGILL